MKRRKEFIAAKIEEKGHHAKIDVRRAVGVSKSSWYRWEAGSRQRTQKQLADSQLTTEICEIWKSSDEVFGSVRITAKLREQGHHVNRKRVVRLMQLKGLVSQMPYKRVRQASPNAGNASDLVQRCFRAAERDRVWATDITYIRTDEGWLYLAAITDLFSRRVVGWAADDHQRTELVLTAVRRAVRARKPVQGLVLHSDHGCQFTSGEYHDVLMKHGMRPSMGAVGTCYDNATAESFWASLKKEKINRYRWRTRRQALTAIRRYITWYNSHRPHSTIDQMAPAAFELRAAA